jgi:hypothetical protein
MKKQTKTEEMKQEIENHEEIYIHVPKRSFGFFFLTILLVGLTIGSFLVTIDSWKFLELGNRVCSEEICNYQPHDLLIIPILIINYILIGLSICSFASMFTELKSYEEKGLIWGLIVGLIVGLIWGLILGLIGGLIVGLIGGLIVGSIYGF